MRTVTRMTLLSPQPLFPTLASCRALLLHFRFIATSFVNALTEYVFDIAIGANFDAFLARLFPDAHEFADVYALAECHSAVMDDILSACLLRSGQRAVGDLLRGVLEVLLDFGVFVGQLYLGHLSELEAAPRLHALFASFRGKMQTTVGCFFPPLVLSEGCVSATDDTTVQVKVLHALVEANAGSLKKGDYPSTRSQQARLPPGGTTSLHHLLLRLDTGDFWTSSWDPGSQGTA